MDNHSKPQPKASAPQWLLALEADAEAVKRGRALEAAIIASKSEEQSVDWLYSNAKRRPNE